MIDFICLYLVLFVVNFYLAHFCVCAIDSNSGVGFLLFYNIAEASEIKRFIEFKSLSDVM